MNYFGDIMVTRYDVFELIFGLKGLFRPRYVKRKLKRISYDQSYKLLLELRKEGLIFKKKGGFQIRLSPKSNQLYALIRFCIKNGINYNDLLDKNMTSFIAKALLRTKFTIKDFNLNPRTFAKYVKILHQNGLLLILSRRPLEATILYNPFLGDLLKYFGKKVLVAKPKDDGHLKIIEKELDSFKKLRKKNERKYQEIVKTYEIQFIQHSLNLEGNPITLPETVRLLKDHIISKDMKIETIEEVQNYQKAVEKMLMGAEDKKPLTKESILNHHYISMQHKPHLAGKIRTLEVYIRNNPKFRVAKVKEIIPKLDKLLERYNKFIYGKKHTLAEILDFASYFHNEFQHIHPFEDGNSRTTRLLTFHLLRSQDVPIIDIPLGLLEEYVSSTKGATKRNDKKLMKILERIIFYNVRTINEQLR